MVFYIWIIFSLWWWRNFASIKAMKLSRWSKMEFIFSWEIVPYIRCNCFASTKKNSYYTNCVTYLADILLLYTFNGCDSAHDTSRNRQMETTQSYLECPWEGCRDTGLGEQLHGKCSSARYRGCANLWPSLQLEEWLLHVETCSDTLWS